MLKVLIGTDWVANRAAVMDMIAHDVACCEPGRILLVPELISHDMERRLCMKAGDTACRYAEVLSFSRLARRVLDSVERPSMPCLDAGGRVVAMAHAVKQAQSRLKAYASLGTRPEFYLSLVDAVDEFKRCCIQSEDLVSASKSTQGSLAQKLEELALILECYDSICSRGKCDPRDQINLLLETLEACDYAQNHVFYIDGFPDFTRQNMAVLEHLIMMSPCVVLSMNCDDPNSTQLAFEKAAQTTTQLIRFSKDHGVSVELCKVPGRRQSMTSVSKSLFQGQLTQDVQGLSMFRTETVFQECNEVAERILSLVADGSRYRDISVVCADMATYRNSIESVFNRCNIPVYVSGTEDILQMPVIATVLSAIDAALGGFDQKDILRYVKSALSPVDISACDELENYVILWSITGKKWEESWHYHPSGLGEKWTESAESKVEGLNTVRQQLITPLINLRNGFQSAKTIAEQITVLYSFLEDIELSKQLSARAMELDASGDNRSAQILNQLWEILLSAMEQLYDVLGESYWEPDVLTRLLKLLLSQYSVGTIPPVLDAVTVGPVSAMRCQETEHLFVMGALEGTLPPYGGVTGLLTDQERTTLRSVGLPLTGGGMDGLQISFSEIYGVFCGAHKTTTVSCPAGQPSFVYERLRKMAGEELSVKQNLGAALVSRTDAAAQLARYNASDFAADLGLTSDYNQIVQKREYSLGSVSRNNIEKLYGKNLRLSASQVDKQADCRLGYFLRYGLRIEERKPVTIDPAEFGTYVHAVLEKTVAEVMELGGFRTVSAEQTLQIAQRYSDAYSKERFGELETARLAYLFRRNRHELAMIVLELWNELNESGFLPSFFELQFDQGAAMPAIQISGRQMQAQLRGFVDRVDVWNDGEKDYFRVVDYKTGAKDFDYCDVFNGLGLQMLLYLFALEQGGEGLIGKNPAPAGVQYFPARAPMVSAQGLLNAEEAAAARSKIWKRRGLVLKDEAVLQAMEPSDQPVRLSYTRKKDGSISGDLADSRQLHLLRDYIYKFLENLVDEIASGCVTPNPYTRGSSHDACRYCPYGAVCNNQNLEGRRNYRTISADEFWEYVGEEMSRNG